MAREFKTEESSKILSNKNIQQSLQALQTLLFDSNNPEDVPDKTSDNGSLWLDRNRNGELKYLNNGDWDLIFQDKFSLVDKMIGPKPLNPVLGQLWIDKEYQILMYYDGIAWKDIRSVQNATDYNVSYYRDFLILGPLQSNGDNVIKDSIIKSQFLLPSIKLDKVFANGQCNKKYEQIDSISIQYPVTYLTDKTLMDVHINPQRLVNIRKRMLEIDESRVVNASEINTEFYGFKNNFGTFLNKTNDNNTDYISYGSGIKISTKVAEDYDFILAVTYEFGTAKTEGKLIRNSIEYNSMDNSLYIGKIPTNKVVGVFMGGLCLNEADKDFSFNRASGYIKFKTTSELDTAIILFSKKQEDKIGFFNKEKNMFQIDLYEEFQKPILFLNGLALEEKLGDYIYDKSHNKIFIKTAKLGMVYSIFETNDKYVNEGTVDKSSRIVYDKNLIKTNGNNIIEEPIVFVNGLYIPKSEVIGNNGELSIFGLKKNMDYIVLKNKIKFDEHGNRTSDLLFHGTIKYITIPTFEANKALVYIDGKMLNNASAAVKSVMPSKEYAYENQIIKLVCDQTKKDYETEQEVVVFPKGWYRFKNKAWIKMNNPEKEKKLDKSIVGYLEDVNEINIMPLFEDENKIAECEVYAYKFANTVEKPLLFGDFDLKDDNVPKDGTYNYRLQYNHYYAPRTNSISLWLNGLKQYDILDVDTNAIGLYDNPNTLPNNEIVKNHVGFYVLERPEGGEAQSCERVVATKLPNCKNIYSTNNIPLTPGNIRLFVSGLRQPKEAFTILDDFTFLLKGDIMDNKEKINGENILVNNYTQLDSNNNIVGAKKIIQTIEDKILVEIRQDYRLSEITIDVRTKGQRIFTCAGDGIPESLIETKDTVICYLNGVCCGIAVPNKKTMSIEIIDDNITKNIGKDLIKEALEDMLINYGSSFYVGSQDNTLTKFDKALIRYRKLQGMPIKAAKNIVVSDNLLFDNYISNKKDRVTFEWR